MTLGTGVFLSTVLLVLVAAAYQLTVRRKWKPVGVVFGGVVSLLLLCGLGIYGWQLYEQRPTPVTDFGGVRLGASPVDVKLALGPPNNESEAGVSKEEEEVSLGWVFGNLGETDHRIVVLFYGKDERSLEASIVCEDNGFNKVFGLGRYTPEVDVIEKLGEPSYTSIRTDATSKMISYAKWHVAFEIERGSVVSICATKLGKVKYRDEFRDLGLKVSEP